MNGPFDMELTFTDGTTETVYGATGERVHEGVLRLFREEAADGRSEKLGAWPVRNLRKWKPVVPG